MESWPDRFLLFKGSLPPDMPSIPTLLPLPSTQQVYYGLPLNFQGSLAQLKYVFIITKTLTEYTFDWAGRLLHHSLSNPHLGMREDLWESLLSGDSLVRDLNPQVRPKIPGRERDWTLYPSNTGIQSAKLAVQTLGLHSLFTIVDENPTLSFQAMGIEMRQHWWVYLIIYYSLYQSHYELSNDWAIHMRLLYADSLTLNTQTNALVYEAAPVAYNRENLNTHADVEPNAYQPYDPLFTTTISQSYGLPPQLNNYLLRPLSNEKILTSNLSLQNTIPEVKPTHKYHKRRDAMEVD